MSLMCLYLYVTCRFTTDIKSDVEKDDRCIKNIPSKAPLIDKEEADLLVIVASRIFNCNYKLFYWVIYCHFWI